MTPPADRTDRDDTEGGGDAAHDPGRTADDGGDAVHVPHAADAPADGRQAHAADVFLAGQDPEDAERVASTTGRWTASGPRCGARARSEPAVGIEPTT